MCPTSTLHDPDEAVEDSCVLAPASRRVTQCGGLRSRALNGQIFKWSLVHEDESTVQYGHRQTVSL